MTMRIKVVGPCASGKSALATRLRALGYDAGSAAQDHSYVPDMWKILTDPDVLIYLDASFDTCQRRKPLSWQQADYEAQLDRLRHAREHCDLYLETDNLTTEEVLERAMATIQDTV